MLVMNHAVINYDATVVIKRYCAKPGGGNVNLIRLLSKQTCTHTLAWQDDGNSYALHIKDDVQKIDTDDCTSKSLECIAIHGSHDPLKMSL